MQQLKEKPIIKPRSTKQSASKGAKLSNFAAALAIFLIVNLVFSFVTPTRSQTIEQQFALSNASSLALAGTWPWWITKAYLEQTSAPDLVLLGSSQMATAVFTSDAQKLLRALDCVTYRNATTLAQDLAPRLRKQPTTFNWAMGGAMASDQDMVAHALLTGTLKPKLVVIGISPRDFIDNTLPSASSTETFRFFSHFVDLGSLEYLAFPDDLARINFYINKHFPLCQLHSKVSKYLSSDKPIETQSQQQFLKGISASGGTMSPGQWLVPANIPYMFVDNTQEYMHRYACPNPPIYASQLAFFGDFLDLMKQNNIKVLVVGMPSVAPNRKLLPDAFWDSWRATISGLCLTKQADWLDLSDSPTFVLDDYLDTVHLSCRGGTKLFAQIAGHIAEKPYLRAALNSTGVIARLHSRK